MGKLELYDGTYFDYVGVDNNSGTSLSRTFISSLYEEKLNWSQYTVLLANFNDSISGSNFSGDFNNVDHFEIFKKTSDENNLRKVYQTNNNKETIIEDFAVDGSSECIYYVYPICKSEDGNYIVNSYFEESITNNNTGFVSLMGLTPDSEMTDTYYINEDEIWRFELNIENNGTMLNIDKTFSDTQHRFPKMTGGNRKYNKASVKGLIGKFNCDDGYVDSNTLISEWETFAASNTLKLFKDKRGRLMLCDIDSSSIEYMDCIQCPAVVSFSIIELESINNVNILGRSIPYNIATSTLLMESNGAGLLGADDKIILASNES